MILCAILCRDVKHSLILCTHLWLTFDRSNHCQKQNKAAISTGRKTNINDQDNINRQYKQTDWYMLSPLNGLYLGFPNDDDAVF